MRSIILSFCLICLTAFSAFSQAVPFSKGINLTNWFQANGPRQIQFTKYTQEDFQQIKSLGCDVIRLPINLHAMTLGAPDYVLDPLFLQMLDQVVDMAEAEQIYLILDNHTFDPAANTDPNIGDVLIPVWKQMAHHFRNRSPYVLYEILNEPHGISDQLWNSIQQEVVDSIRTVDQSHTLIIGPAGYNSLYNLAAMPVYTDTNLIYTFHFYEPFIFTHQGASWSDPSLVPLAGVPFPYDAATMPALPGSLVGTWIESAYNDYPNTGTVSALQQNLDIAVQFQQNRNVPIFCGEFGVYIPNSDDNDRVGWYQQVRSYLEANGIAWTSWDYHGGFGLYESGGNDLFDHDLNVPLLNALGFNVPPQSPFVVVPDTSGRVLYDDYIGQDIVEANANQGALNYFAMENPNYGDYSIYWSGAVQYNHIGFDFQPNRDLSQLVDSSYALDFFIRGKTPGTSIDIRFLDTHIPQSNDLPWRIRLTLSDNQITWDGRWQHLHLPLSSFVEHGAWDGMWHNPQGDFDWQAIDRFEIVAEHHDLNQVELWFDHIQLTNQDTAQVRDFTAVSIDQPDWEGWEVSVYPVPARDWLYLRSHTPVLLRYQLLDVVGRILRVGSFTQQANWDLSPLPAGLYWLRLEDPQGKRVVKKIWKP